MVEQTYHKDYNDCSTSDVEYLWFNSLQRIDNLATNLQREGRTGNGDDLGSKLDLLLSQLLLETSDAMRINKELTKRYEREIWELACKHDGIDPDSKFVVFSRENPYQKGVA